MFKRLIGIIATVAALCLTAVTPAAAQVFVVQNCGTVPASMKTLTPGSPGMLFTDTNGVLCDGGGGIVVAQPYNYTAVAGAQYGLTIAASTALTVPATALQAQVCVSGNSVKYTFDGTTPTASVGLPLATGQCIQFSGTTILAALRFIQTAATATLDVGYTK